MAEVFSDVDLCGRLGQRGGLSGASLPLIVGRGEVVE
jgi:hypothetical protein